MKVVGGAQEDVGVVTRTRWRRLAEGREEEESVATWVCASLMGPGKVQQAGEGSCESSQVSAVKQTACSGWKHPEWLYF